MELRYHQSANNAAEWNEGSLIWDDRLGWGAVRVNCEWLVDVHGNRRRFKTEAGAKKAAEQFTAGPLGPVGGKSMYDPFSGEANES